jgi:hypothetical protein
VLCVRVLAPTEGLCGAVLVGRVLQQTKFLFDLEHKRKNIISNNSFHNRDNRMT